MLLEPPALQFNVIINSESPRKNGTESKRSVEYSKYLVFNSEDRMLKAITRQISFKTINEIGRGIYNMS